MPKYDDKAQDGLPPEDTQQKASYSFIGLFAVVGVLLAILILLFQNLGEELSWLGIVPTQVVINCLVAGLIGGLQAWIFRDHIKSRLVLFIGFSLLGGLVAGLIGGSLISGGIREPLIIGFISGAITGGISSSSQNRVMKNTRYAQQWFFYNLVSWAVIFSIGWFIGWSPYNFVALAFAAVFLLIATGIGLVVFLNRIPQIEFS